MTINYKDLKDNGNSMVLEREEKVSIEQNETSLIKRRHTYVKERFRYPISTNTEQKQNGAFNNHSTSIDEDINFVEEIRKTQINLKNLSDNINIQMKKLKHQRSKIMKDTQHFCKDCTAIRNDLTWDQNFGKQNIINDICSPIISYSSRILSSSYQPDPHLNQNIEEKDTQINNILKASDEAFKSLSIKPTKSELLANKHKFEKSQTRNIRKLRRRYGTLNEILSKQTSYRENAVTPSSEYNYSWAKYQCKIPNRPDSVALCNEVSSWSKYQCKIPNSPDSEESYNVDKDIQHIKMKYENTSTQQYRFPRNLYCNQCEDLFSKEIKYTAQRRKLLSPNLQKDISRKINAATNTHVNKRFITPIWRRATETIKTEDHKIKEDKNKKLSGADERKLVKNRNSPETENIVDDVSFASNLGFETLRNLRKMKIKPYKAIKYYWGDKYNIHILPQETTKLNKNRPKVSGLGVIKNSFIDVKYKTKKKPKKKFHRTTDIMLPNINMAIRDKIIATQEKYKKVREELKKSVLQEGALEKSPMELNHKIADEYKKNFNKVNNSTDILTPNQEHSKTELLTANSLPVKSSDHKDDTIKQTQFVPSLEPPISHINVQPKLQTDSFNYDSSQRERLPRLSTQLLLQRHKFNETSQLVAELSHLELLPQTPNNLTQSEDILHLKPPVKESTLHRSPPEINTQLGSKLECDTLIKKTSFQGKCLASDESMVKNFMQKHNVETIKIPLNQNNIETQPSSELQTSKLKHKCNCHILNQTNKKSSSSHNFQQMKQAITSQSNSNFSLKKESSDYFKKTNNSEITDIDIQCIKEEPFRSIVEKKKNWSDTNSTEGTNNSISDNRPSFEEPIIKSRIFVSPSLSSTNSYNTNNINKVPVNFTVSEDNRSQKKGEKDNNADNQYTNLKEKVKNSGNDSEPYYDLDCEEFKILPCPGNTSFSHCSNSTQNEIEVNNKAKTRVEGTFKCIKNSSKQSSLTTTIIKNKNHRRIDAKIL